MTIIERLDSALASARDVRFIRLNAADAMAFDKAQSEAFGVKLSCLAYRDYLIGYGETSAVMTDHGSIAL